MEAEILYKKSGRDEAKKKIFHAHICCASFIRFDFSNVAAVNAAEQQIAMKNLHQRATSKMSVNTNNDEWKKKMTNQTTKRKENRNEADKRNVRKTNIFTEKKEEEKLPRNV